MNFGLVLRYGFRLVALIVLGFAPGNAFGTIVIQDEVPGTQYTGTVIDAVVGGGVDQVGLLVTVQYSTFTSTAIPWVADSGPSLVKGSAAASGWTLSADADGTSEGTFGDADEVVGGSGNDILDTLGLKWTFLHSGVSGGAILERITLDGSAANIVFDRPVLNGTLVATPYNPVAAGGDGSLPTPRAHEGVDDRTITGDSDEIGTAGSERGRDFYAPSFDNFVEPGLHVTFMNQVGSVGDLFTKVVLDFTSGGTTSGLSPASISSFSFAIDTDKTAGLTAVPEPSALVFGSLICGVTGLAAGCRRWFGNIEAKQDA